MAVDQRFIVDKLNSSVKYLASLKLLLQQPQSKFSQDLDSQLKGERLFEILVQIMIDVCTHIVANSAEPTPTSYSDCMLALSRLKVIPNDFADKCVKIIKMRNLITHQYDVVDHKILYDGLRALQQDFLMYQKAVLAWVKSFSAKQE